MIGSPTQEPRGSDSNGSSLIDECLARARAMVGTTLDRSLRQKNLEASRSAIKRYALGIGDDNPLWCDADYANRSPLGTLVAPPTFVFSVDDTGIAEPRIHGLSVLHAEDDIEFFRRIRRDDELSSTCKIIEVTEKSGRRAPRMVQLAAVFEYRGPDNTLFARMRAVKLRVPTAENKGGLDYQAKPPHEYSAADMERIRDDALNEVRRGAEPRVWQDVAVGDTLTPVVKGPLTLRDMLCYYAGNGVAPDIYRAHELAFRGPGLEGTKHVDPTLAVKAGMPGAYDIGHQRIGWVGHLLTNWMGDEGFLKRLQFRITRPNVFGDTTWCQGTIVGKRIQDGDYLVDCSVRTVNQNQETTGEGQATILLPTNETPQV